MKSTEILLLWILFLTGLSAGLGFGNAVGYMPGMSDTPANHMLSFWQHVDHYFRARMPIFGNTLLLSMIVTLILLRKDWSSLLFWCIALSFVACVADLIVIITQNLPLNKIIQNADAEKPLTIDFETIRQKAMRAYYTRAFLNIISFVLVLCGVALYWKTYFKRV